MVQVEPGKFVHTIPASRLPAGLDALLGHALSLRAIDRSGFENTSSATTIIRVIDETPLALSPDDLSLLDNDQPIFEWAPVVLPYPYTFRIDVVRVDQNVQSTVQVIEDIPSTETMHVASEAIPTGRYFWTVSVVDEFGNRSRSREAGFRIP